MGYRHQGYAHEQKGDLSKALESFFKALDISNARGDKRELGSIYTAIAAVYAGMGNKQNVKRYYTNAIEIFEGLDDKIGYAIAIENLGDSYLEWAQPDSALILFNMSGPIFKAQNRKPYLAYNLGNKGLAFAQKGQEIQAEENISEAISILEELGDYRPITVYLTYMSDIYADRNDWDAAFGYSLRSLNLAKQYGLKAEMGSAYLKLSELYERTGYASAALKYYRNYIAFRDSVQNITSVQQMAEKEVAQKQIELDLANQQKRTQKIVTISIGTALFLIFLLAAGLFRRNLYIKRTKAIIEKEKDRSDRLLLNILPEETAQELKESGVVKANKFQSVTVLFTDFVAFTAHSEEVGPEVLVNRLGDYFTAFDEIIEKYGLEKIKTVGDSYMCAGGLPFPIKDHAVKMVHGALEILKVVEEAKADRKGSGLAFDIRIGINTGPVVAGVVGSKKFSYDIWGDTVNVASRMESMSESGRINISEFTYELVKNEFNCTYRGEFEVKNRGKMKMYFVKGPHSKKGHQL
ncbi:adenylate/guanylate cyclase domain-containing protein [uncultured Eudoraea sp.]|uniref:adenylate/guanylate cyclase domain-containing protein n=1 Tax=uncultured Eudoraea sp. TaxID=1035614 RepID=UPI002636FA08|nr:adenylate/guanylate cyclase domain-containing protein [uncultured Eudoraea sp.]